MITPRCVNCKCEMVAINPLDSEHSDYICPKCHRIYKNPKKEECEMIGGCCSC